MPGRPQHAVDYGAYRAIAAMHHDQVHPVGYRRLSEFGPVTAVVGVLNRELKAAFEGVRQQVAAGWCGGGRSGVDDQHCTHDARA